LRLSLVVVGLALLVVGSIPIILGTNEILALNDCASGGRFCVVRSGGGFCSSELCTIDPFYGQASIEGIRSLAYSLIEIGAIVAIAGVAATVIGAKAKPSSHK
jgi:hypothetical protein